jgi:hypothetical protein
MVPTRGTIRVMAVVNFAILLAVVLPALVGHPYPRPFAPFIGYGGIALYLVVGLYQLKLSLGLDPRARGDAPAPDADQTRPTA